MTQTIEQQLQLCKDKGYFEFFKAAAKKYALDICDLLGICSRETVFKNIIGDGGHGHGLMQIDDRSHKKFLDNPAHKNGLDPASNIDYGASILKQNMSVFKGNREKAIAAYNCGPGGVIKSLAENKGIDGHTAHGNYSKDVIARAEEFRKLLAKEV